MKIKLSLSIVAILCATQAVFALPQVEDAGEATPVTVPATNPADYLASAGPIASADISQTEFSQKSSGINDDLLARMNALEAEVQQLVGRVDELQHAVKQSQTESAQQFLILNKKIAETPAPLVTSQPSTMSPAVTPAVIAKTPASSPIAAPAATPEAQEKATYDAAYGLVSAKAYADAIDAFTGYLNIYPNGKYAANANYWLGELNANQQSYPTALKYLQVVVDQYPQSTKAADALLKLGIINKRLGNDAKAKAWFDQLLKQYPQSSAAKSAKEYIS